MTRHLTIQPPCPPPASAEACERDRRVLYDALAKLLEESSCGIFDPSASAWRQAERALEAARGEVPS